MYLRLINYGEEKINEKEDTYGENFKIVSMQMNGMAGIKNNTLVQYNHLNQSTQSNSSMMNTRTMLESTASSIDGRIVAETYLGIKKQTYYQLIDTCICSYLSINIFILREKRRRRQFIADEVELRGVDNITIVGHR